MQSMYLISKRKTSRNQLKSLITQYTNSQNIKQIVYNTNVFLKKLCENVINILYYKSNPWEILGEEYMDSSILFFFQLTVDLY